MKVGGSVKVVGGAGTRRPLSARTARTAGGARACPAPRCSPGVGDMTSSGSPSRHSSHSAHSCPAAARSGVKASASEKGPDTGACWPQAAGTSTSGRPKSGSSSSTSAARPQAAPAAASAAAAAAAAAAAGAAAAAAGTAAGAKLPLLTAASSTGRQSNGSVEASGISTASTEGPNGSDMEQPHATGGQRCTSVHTPSSAMDAWTPAPKTAVLAYWASGRSTAASG